MGEGVFEASAASGADATLSEGEGVFEASAASGADSTLSEGEGVFEASAASGVDAIPSERLSAASSTPDLEHRASSSSDDDSSSRDFSDFSATSLAISVDELGDAFFSSRLLIV